MKSWIKRHSKSIFILVMAFALYANTLSHEYAWDDTIVILENDRVKQGLNGIADLFKNIKSDQIQHRYGYRPITLLTFAIEFEYFGLNPRAGHFTNVLLFSLLCCLVFYFLRRLFPQKNTWFAFAVTCLFLVHPIHTEVVANIKSRDEILVMLFGLLSLLSFLNFLEKEKRRGLHFSLSMFFLLIAFLSRENAVVFAGILALLAYFKKGINLKPHLKYAGAVLGFLLILAIRAISYSEKVFQDNSKYYADGFVGNPLIDARSIWEILPNSLYILWADLRLLIMPYPLVHDYGYGYSMIIGWENPLVWLSLIFHLGVGFYVIKNIKKKSILSFGILFYFITLGIYLHLLVVGPDYMAERYLFIPSLGFIIVLIILLEQGIKRVFSIKEISYKTRRGKGIIVMFVLLMLAGSIATINRNRVWKNNQTLFAADIGVLTNGSRANYNYAAVLHKRYYEAPSEILVEKILLHYQKSVDVTDRSLIALLDLGNAYMEFGYPDKGKTVFEHTVKQYPNESSSYFQLGKYYFSQNEYQKANELYSNATKKGMANAETHYMNSICLIKLQRPEEAMQELNNGLKYDPKNYEYFELMAEISNFNGQKKEALHWLQKAMEIEPGNLALKQKLDKLKVEDYLNN